MSNAPDFRAGVHPGEVLAGKYRVERVLGAGGMGVVVAAHHIQLETRVALKFLLPGALDNHEAVGRFLREARAAVKITNEHVARVSDVGTLDSGAPYIVMEYLEGVDLSGWLKQQGPLPIELAVDFVLQTCEAIADAHALGIVHRDLKPANLFCIHRSDQLCIKVLDFGISKVMAPGAAGHDMTKTNAMVGSPFYMSPEQMAFSKWVDGRTDIWALGVILFELLTARTPFEGEAVTELAIKVATQPTPPARALRPEIAPALDQVIATCLEKDRERRFPTVGELAIALKPHGSRQARASVERILGTLRQAGLSNAVLPLTGSFPVTPVPSLAPSSSTPSTASSWGQSASTAKPRGKAGIVLASVLGLALVAAGVGALVLRRHPEVSAVPPPAAAVLDPPTAPASQAPTATPTSTTTATATAPPTTTSSATATATPTATPTVTATPRPAVRHSQPAPHPKVSCDPPYTLDAKGAHVFKKECL